MTIDSERKLFIGPKLRRIRRELGLSQTRMAEDLGISPSYANLMERNQRPVSAQILLKLADVYDLDVKMLASSEDDRSRAEIGEIFGDPLFRDLTIAPQELRELVESCPTVADALQRLYSAYQQTQGGGTSGGEAADGGPVTAPVDIVRAAIETSRNYFPALDEAAEALAGELAVGDAALLPAMIDRLRARHGVRVRVLPADVMADALRRFDRHRRQLQLSEMVGPSGRTFQVAFQLAMIEQAEIIDRTVEDCALADPTARRMFRIYLANYFAGALMMPYGRFFAAAEASRYDLALLSRRFEASFEQVCHRLTTLQRPTAKGVPFFMIRVDDAGNVSKRYASGRFHLSRYGGTCPIWNLHETFRAPNEILTQRLELADGSLFFSIATAVAGTPQAFPRREARFAIGLVCEMKYAPRLVYADTEGPAAPIGTNCRLCERNDCAQRAEAPASRPILIDETMRRVVPFFFDPRRGSRGPVRDDSAS
ncbi:short-chain fatty acyl-CoA regulator family protein [Kaistia dalseonensis]|uniref:Transcriptional regulator/DNA-binding XRE family transcriptional regulator n=1 Tax=Kaistia dalseonensis TaxID=410840 RepID=A0ABU0HE56_9HYPH|nr:helix-turn-helix transcriptional regulator [Kaistia dalseonensis]MCX5497127.1 short-chain fatty acyl-CoA regulator family protein [Kaistia dalseonensis]MDQ0439754.1 putative transcriptional regulator/DNA-binding XRE family transcriptional regulator [Kaistia dalseonensis]